jgi:hypothetical protein
MGKRESIQGPFFICAGLWVHCSIRSPPPTSGQCQTASLTHETRQSTRWMGYPPPPPCQTNPSCTHLLHLVCRATAATTVRMHHIDPSTQCTPSLLLPFLIGGISFLLVVCHPFCSIARVTRSIDRACSFVCSFWLLLALHVLSICTSECNSNQWFGGHGPCAVVHAHPEQFSSLVRHRARFVSVRRR